VFPVPALVGQVQGNEVPLADPLQQIWDLQDLGGADRIEAAGRLREWLLNAPDRIALGATSVADDLGYVALADLAQALGGITDDYRVIGGHMVTVLAARWQLGHDLYRETGDVDLGIPPIVARDHNLVSRLKDLNLQCRYAGTRSMSPQDCPIISLRTGRDDRAAASSKRCPGIPACDVRSFSRLTRL